jgi:hypothetical protein
MYTQVLGVSPEAGPCLQSKPDQSVVNSEAHSCEAPYSTCLYSANRTRDVKPTAVPRTSTPCGEYGVLRQSETKRG